MKTENYTISIYTENKLGLLNRISSVFLKSRINIESLTINKTDNENISEFTVGILTSEDKFKKIVKQIEKQIEILKVEYSKPKAE